MNTTKISYLFYPAELISMIKRSKSVYTAPITIADKNNTRFIAHRGLSGLHRENTVAAFNAAGAEQSYFGIETDVHITADGKFVIIHDDRTGRVSESNISVEDSTLAELKRVRLYAKNGETSEEATTIPLLKDYLRACKQSGKTGVLELKNHFEREAIYRITEEIEEENCLDNIIFISFDLANLIVIREKYPTIPAEFLTTRFDKALLPVLNRYNLDIDIYYHELNKKRVDALKKAGIKINCWTVDSARAAKKLIALGVDYLTTNILN